MGVEDLTGLDLDNIWLFTPFCPLLLLLYLRGLRKLFFTWVFLPQMFKIVSCECCCLISII